MTSSFSFTNTSEGSTVTTVAVNPVSNYGRIKDEPTEAQLSNKTCTIDQGEIITYRCRNVPNVASQIAVLYPAKVTAGVEFGVRLDELLRTKDGDGNIVCDEPIVATLTFKCPKSSNINAGIIDQVASRLLGACYDETQSKFRWDDLMRSALIPSEN